MGLRMLLLLHALIPYLAAYILPSSPVLLHIYCTCFSTFWHCHPYILQHFNGNAFTPFRLIPKHLVIATQRVGVYFISESDTPHTQNGLEL